uniref:Putative hyphally regulated cell wall protein 1-like isoform x2 n=2 Tax=Haematobia irritans TaxID=7368 RepID=A0A1L8EAS7_HAEIR
MQFVHRLALDPIWVVKNLFLWILLSSIQRQVIAVQRTCYKCEGINCQRTTYKEVETCHSDISVCVTVYEGETIRAQGCLENIPEKLRNKCEGNTIDSLKECHKCSENLCNVWAPSSYECVQCDSKQNPNCAAHGAALKIEPTRCHISRTPNIYCYTVQEGERIMRGCTPTIEDQTTCAHSDECLICNPSILPGCNRFSPNDGDSPEPTPTENPNPQPSGASATGIGEVCYAIMAMIYVVKYL